MKNGKRFPKIRSLACVALSVLMVLAMSVSVFASTSPAPGRPGEGLSDDIKNKLTVHKYSTSSASQTHGNGLELTAEEAKKLGTALPGVGFTLYKLAATPAIDADPDALVSGATSLGEKETNADGVAFWDELDAGYYVLKETTPPDIDLENPKYEPAATTIITLPFGVTVDEDGDWSGVNWNHDVHVYPKNVKLSDLSKETSTGAEKVYNVGDTIGYVIESKVLVDKLFDEAGPTHGAFSISDKLDSRLDYIATQKVLAQGGTSGTLELTAGTHYSVTLPSETNSNTVSWVLTPAGLEAVQAEGATSVRVEFTTKVNNYARDASPNATPVIYNGASTAQKAADGTEDGTTIPDDERETAKLAHLEVRKREWIKDRQESDPETFLNGAEFKIALTLDDAKAGTFVKKLGADGNPTTQDLVLVTNTSADGKVGWGVFTGLPMNSDATKPTEFYLVEIKAPSEEYIKSQSAWKAVIAAGQSTGTITIDNQRIDDDEGPMPEENPTFKLPKTGGMGTVMFALVGGALMILGIFLIVKTRKRGKAKS